MNLSIVMLGGAIGAGGRYLFGTAVYLRFGAFPWGTLTVNLIGGLLMGVLAGSILRGSAGEGARLLLGIGVLGGFTTFSAFSLDVVRLLDSGQVIASLGYLTASVVGSVALTFVGLALVRAA